MNVAQSILFFKYYNNYIKLGEFILMVGGLFQLIFTYYYSWRVAFIIIVGGFHLWLEGCCDEDMVSTRAWNADSVQVPIGQVTRARVKRFKEGLSGLIQHI